MDEDEKLQSDKQAQDAPVSKPPGKDACPTMSYLLISSVLLGIDYKNTSQHQK